MLVVYMFTSHITLSDFFEVMRKMLRNELIWLFRPFYERNVVLLHARCKSLAINIDQIERESSNNIAVSDDETTFLEQEIERKRNKSRLKGPDRNFLFEKNPYPEPTRWHHGTLKYMRRLYGRYGEGSGLNPSICWPVKEELEEAMEYERVAYPFSIPQIIAEAKAKRHDKQEQIKLRQENIVKKIEKLEEMKEDLKRRMEKKESEARNAKERKERLVEEVRMHFGYTVDPRDDKFKELLAKKEKEQKKAEKEARRMARDESLLSRMLAKKTDKANT